MKRKSYDDNQIHDLVKKLPSLEDRQKKDDLYRNIQKKMNKPKKTKAPWVVPTFASVAVVILMIMIVPTVWNSMNDQFQSYGGEEKSGSASDRADQSASSEEAAENDNATMESLEKNTDREQSSASSDLNRMTKEVREGKPMVYFDSQAQIVIPVTWIEGEKYTEEELAKLAANRYGLTQPSGSYTFRTNDNEATVTFPTGFKANGSALENAIVRAIQWRAWAYGVDEINVSTTEGNSVNLGNRGEINQLSTIEAERFLYQVFTSTRGVRFLVPVSFKGSITEALSEMKVDRVSTSPAVPEHLTFEEVEDQDKRLLVRVNHEPWHDPQERVTAVEAILLTAKQYGFEEVKLEGINPTRDSEYDYSKPIQVPEMINPIQP